MLIKINLDNYYAPIVKKHVKYAAADIWRPHAYRSSIGSCVLLYNFLKPKTPQEFLDKYIENGKNRPSNLYDIKKYYGRTEEEIIQVATKYMNDILLKFPNDEVTLQECVDIVIYHTIIETFYGVSVENEVKCLLEDAGYTIKTPETYERMIHEDSLGIDIRAEKNGKEYIFQIKPHTTFLYRGNPDLITDRKRFYENIESTNKEYPNTKNKYFFLIYYRKNNEILWYCKKNDAGEDRFTFRLEDFCYKNGEMRDVNYKDILERKKLLIT
ncbi:MAG: hypothetical protein FWC41_09065 [Firmicutes bacterium]|nr:hypothetical protein [Bacillota bacterium]